MGSTGVVIYALLFQSNEVFAESSESMYLVSKNEYIDALVYVPAALHGLLYLVQVKTIVNSIIFDPFRSESTALLVNNRQGYIGY